MTDEARWLRLSRAGDREAFEALVGPHYAAARSFAARLLGNLDDGEDAVQDALMSAWLHIDSYRGAGTSGVRSWFMRIVFNRCTDLRRRASTRRTHEAAAPGPTTILPDPRPEHRETLARVRAAIEALPPKQRAALHLRIMEDMSYQQIADVLDITPGTARVYMVRARSVLRDQLGEELP